MEALDLLGLAQAAGYRIGLVDGELVVRGPSHGHESILADLRAAKPALLALLRAEASAPAWVEIDGQSFSPAAADLYRRSVPFSAPRSATTCARCFGERWWRLHAGCPWGCARCHPPARTEAEVEWRSAHPSVAPGVVRHA